MAISIGSGGDDEVNASINTTPLVDVMLVLLIIFLITIPVVTQTVPVKLPQESNIARQTRPENIEIAVDAEGQVFWNAQAVQGPDDLLDRLKAASVKQPQPEVHIRGDQKARYEFIGRVVFAAQRAAISKISFVTQPAAKG
ncbi:biopolymer transporter ExbD [Aquabacterium soli]|jgi:biopolymer transport protein ExbD|uniref:Biopolymer transporter ExbD n=1 Tax=Aquabacterium soli TaxID=2493092 RepID=A0A426V8S2_9BURK|nr:biopolymer transporter ExbD [Aquabacterium soli]RRS03170.1 biopolymer transporter ExbD [Aquabacterium soli]